MPKSYNDITYPIPTLAELEDPTNIKVDTDSTIKGVIDTWYNNGLKVKTDSAGNSYADYLSDTMFCNDRKLYSGSGYKLEATSYYMPYRRLINLKLRWADILIKFKLKA